MGDISNSINFAQLERRLDRVAESTGRIERELDRTNSRLSQVVGDISSVKLEISSLRAAFENYIDDAKRSATLQKAATELIRVRQELDQSFGGYKIVRETMLGVLQATDLALVKKTTISQVTEELMLSTPDYWLAPCLVAVAAWIGNDRDLANRAIKEAIKRDEEKTALTMALVCRRNNRTDTCFEWLSIYFAKQRAENFTESNFTYLNAYLNGVFGPDSKHMCDDYVSKWMQEIQGHNESFEAEQTQLWRDYCAEFTVDLEGQFPHMRSSVHEYADIAEYVGRINSIDSISGNFSGIQNVRVDEDLLRKDIDQTLVSLISRCDDKEEPLRKEERYLQAIRYFDGDTEAAKRSVIEADRKRTEDAIDLVGQMTNIITKKENARPSERKTSVSFLRSYIRSGFHQYISEKKDQFPQKITFKVDSWTGNTTDGSNIDVLHRGFEIFMNRQRQQAIDSVWANTPKPKQPAVWMIILMIIFFPFGIAYWISSSETKKAIEASKHRVYSINEDYDKRIAVGHRKIDEIVTEWKQAKAIVTDFESRELPDIVA